MSHRLARLFALHCSIAIAACGGSGSSPCTMNSQCASNFCRADGTCGPAATDGPLAGSDSTIGSDGSSALCTPNHDGTITAAELPLAAGQMANFRIATKATWNTAGTANTDGSRAWDLSGQLSGDADQSVALAAPSGAWWAGDFTGASYATPLSASSNLLGVFKFDSTGLTLLGVVSPSGGTTMTELTYDPPAKILALPFMAGSTWTSTSAVSGFAEGVIAAYNEEYDSSVDEVGTMKTPFGTFPVLRIGTVLTRTADLVTLVSNKTFSWASECAGIVATVQSTSSVSGTEFSDDAEVRRLAP